MELIGSFAIGCSARKAAEVGIQAIRKLSTSLRELQTSDSISPELFNEIAQLGLMEAFAAVAIERTESNWILNWMVRLMGRKKVRKSSGKPRSHWKSFHKFTKSTHETTLLPFLRSKAQVPDNSRPSSISSARWLILIGICLTAVGVLSYFQLERHSLYASTRDFEFSFLNRAFYPRYCWD